MIAQELVTLLRFKLEQSGIGRYRAAVQQVRKSAQSYGEAIQKSNNTAVRGANQAAAAYSRLGGIVRAVLGGIGVRMLMSMADDWSSVEGRVSLTTKSVEEQKYVMDELFKSAQRNRQEFTATADLFQKVARNKDDLGLSTDQTLQLTDVIGKSMVIGGGDAGAQQAALLQLGQALSSGTLRGDELNSILEQSPRLAQAIADAFGVPVGKLREMGKEGRLTSKELAQGLLKQADKLNEEFERMPKTFSGSFTIIRNKIGQVIHGLNKASGAAEVFYRITNWLVDNFEMLVTLIGGGLVVAKFTLWRNAILGATGATNLLTVAQMRLRRVMNAGVGRTLGQMVRLAAILYGLYLIGQDIYVWLNGGVSVTGSLIGRAEEWADEIETVKNILGFIKYLLGGADMPLKEWIVKFAAIFSIGIALIKTFSVIFSILRGIRMAVGLFSAALTGPIGVILIIIGLLLLIWYYWDDIKAAGAAAWDWIKAKALSAWNSIKAAAAAAWDWVLSRGRAAWEGIKTAVQAVTDFVRTAWDGAIRAVTGWIDNIVQSWNNLKNLVSGGFSFPGFGGKAPLANGGGSYTQNNSIIVNASNNPGRDARNAVPSFRIPHPVVGKF
nr:MAG TPA: tail length tape measure protein [Caudoviricetes sp.]